MIEITLRSRGEGAGYKVRNSLNCAIVLVRLAPRPCGDDKSAAAMITRAAGKVGGLAKAYLSPSLQGVILPRAGSWASPRLLSRTGERGPSERDVVVDFAAAAAPAAGKGRAALA
jgi:hypothetical protein